MRSLSYRGHRFPACIIQHAIWLYLRFTLSYRDVEELLAERGLDLSYETIRRWVLKFGPAIARGLRQRRPRPGDRWHLDEMVVRIAGRAHVSEPKRLLSRWWRLEINALQREHADLGRRTAWRGKPPILPPAARTLWQGMISATKFLAMA